MYELNNIAIYLWQILATSEKEVSKCFRGKTESPFSSLDNSSSSLSSLIPKSALQQADLVQGKTTKRKIPMEKSPDPL